MINYIDVGAHIGEVIDLVVKFLDGLDAEYMVYAFEPYPPAFNLLKDRLGKKNYALYNKACSDYEGRGNIYMSSSRGGHSLKKTKHNINLSRFNVVDVIKFSTWFVNNIKPADFNIVKINIEGSEYEVYEDIIKSGLVKDIDVFCGSLGDLHKIGKPAHEAEAFAKHLKDSGIEVVELSVTRLDALKVIEDAMKAPKTKEVTKEVEEEITVGPEPESWFEPAVVESPPEVVQPKKEKRTVPTPKKKKAGRPAGSKNKATKNVAKN